MNLKDQSMNGEAFFDKSPEELNSKQNEILEKIRELPNFHQIRRDLEILDEILPDEEPVYELRISTQGAEESIANAS